MLASQGEEGGDDNLTDFEEEGEGDDFRDGPVSRRGQDGGNASSPEGPTGHWLWNNWILLALLGVVSFASCNLLIGELSSLGVESMNYYCSGSLLFSISYFLYQKEWAKKNATSRGLLDADAASQE